MPEIPNQISKLEIATNDRWLEADLMECEDGSKPPLGHSDQECYVISN
jgi:hypothetical protein